MIATAPPPALAAPMPAPAAERTVAYSLVDIQQGRRFGSRLEARFGQADGGDRLMTVRTFPEAPGAGGVFGMTMNAFAAIPVRYRLDAGGKAVAVLDLDATWNAAASVVARGVAAATRGQPATAPGPRALARFRDAFAAMPEPARQAALLANAQALTGLVPADLPVGGVQPWSGAGIDPAGRPVTLSGTLTRMASGPDAAVYRIEAESDAPGAPASPRVREEMEIVLSRSDGLLVRSRRTLRRVSEAAPFFTETVERSLPVS